MNSSFQNSKAVVFLLTDNAGFFSVFFFLCQAYLYAQKNGYDFFVDSSRWAYTSKYGWHDYFITLKEFDDSNASTYEYIIPLMHMHMKDAPFYTLKDYKKAIEEIYI